MKPVIANRFVRNFAVISVVTALALAFGVGPVSAAGKPRAVGGLASHIKVNPKLAPLIVGWANDDTGAVPFPGATQGAKDAVHYINTTLGGIHGHKIELITCSTDATSQTNQACGEKFANQKAIPFTLVGLSLDSGPYFTALGSKPTLGAIPVSASDYAAKKALWYYGGAVSSQVGGAKWAESLKPTSVVYFYTDDAAGQQDAAQFASLFSGTNIKVTTEPISTTSADVLPAVEQSGVATASVAYVAVADCLPIAQALVTVGFNGAAGSPDSCTSASEIAANPSDFQNWETISQAQSLTLTKNSVAANLFLSQVLIDQQTSNPPTFAEEGWGLVMSMRNALIKTTWAKDDTSKGAYAAFTAFTGPVTLGLTSIKCPGAAPYPNVCAQSGILYKWVNGVAVAG